MSTKAPTARRVRRTPEAARALILETAEARLAAHGLAGLNIADVARDAGISHGTLLHHFGSSAGMRRALVERMAASLLDEVLEIERAPVPDRATMTQFFERLFSRLASGGHARLIAWLAMGADDGGGNAAVLAPTHDRIDALVAVIAERLGRRGDIDEPARVARYVVLLVMSSAIGLGVARDSLLPELALSDADETRFARWLAGVVRANVIGEGDEAED